MSQELIVSASGIRGVVGTALTPEVAWRYGAAFGAYLAETHIPGPETSVLVGRDTRASGPVLVDAIASGLQSGGWRVSDVGVAPTPTILLVTGDDEGARGAVIVTASHNPVEWNGLKLAGARGLFLDPEAGRRVQEIFGEVSPGGELPSERATVAGAVEHHLERILALPFLDVPRVSRQGFTVAVDCVHGAGALIFPSLLERLGCRLVGIGLSADGRFPRNPEPTPENLEELGVLVRRERAHLGMAVDPDGDRLALVDGTGKAVGEDWTLALAVELILSREPGPVVTNLSTSRCVQDAAERAGQPFYRAPVGEANVARRMHEVEAVVGGEGNGGVMLPRLHATRDAPLAAALVLQLLAERGVRLGDMLSSWPQYHISKRKVPRPPGGMDAAYEAMIQDAAPGAVADTQDGVRLEWSDGRWVHVRPSGTEPIVRIIAEARDPKQATQLAGWAGGILECVGSSGT